MTFASTPINATNSPAVVTDYQTLLQKKLSDKIKMGFIELIPEEQFDKMIVAAMDALTNGPRHKRFNNKSVWRNNGYVSEEVPIENNTYSVLADPDTIPGMVYAELKKSATNAVLELTKTEEYQGNWSVVNGMAIKGIVDGVFRDAIKDNASVFVEALIGNVIQTAMLNVFTTMRNNVQNGRSSY